MDAIERMVRCAVPSPARRRSRIWLLSFAVCVLFLGAMSGAVRARTVCSPPTASATAAGSRDCSAGTGSEAGTAPPSPSPRSPSPRSPSPAPPSPPPPSSATTTPSPTSTAPSGGGPAVSSSGDNSGNSCSAPVGSAESGGTAGAVGASALSCPPPGAAAGADAGTPAVSGSTSSPAPPAAAPGSDPPSSTGTGGVADPGPPSSSGPAQPPPGVPAAPPSSSVVVNSIVSDSPPAPRSSTDVGPTVSSGAYAPPGAHPPVPVGRTPPSSTTAPPSAPASTRTGQAPYAASDQQDLARVRRQIGVVEHQLAAEGALHPSLRRLLGHIASLAASVLSLTAPEGRRPQDRAPSTVSSLRDRIVRLDRLLAALGRMSPSSRARLTPALLTLRSLLRSLLRHRATVVSSSASHAGDRGGASVGCACLPERPPGARLAEPAAAGGTPGPHGSEPLPTAGDAMIPSAHPVIHPVHGARPGRQASHQTPAAATPRPVHNPTSVPGGAAGGAGATGAPGGAAAPVTALVVSLLSALLSRLQRVDRTACRPRLLELRPERPG
jgi:hypothetical protein